MMKINTVVLIKSNCNAYRVSLTPEYSVLLGLAISKPKQLHTSLIGNHYSKVPDVFRLCKQ